MANMGYCRFENTYNDLLDCEIALMDETSLSDSEISYAKKLLLLCQELVEQYNVDFIEELRNKEKK